MRDTQKIIAVLRSRSLIETAAARAEPASDDFAALLARFWDYARSPYVRDKLARGQRIGRRHCYDMHQQALARLAGSLTLADLERACPG